MKIEIEYLGPAEDEVLVKNVLQKIANTLTTENIKFIGELSNKQNINTKIQKHKIKMKMLL